MKHWMACVEEDLCRGWTSRYGITYEMNGYWQTTSIILGDCRKSMEEDMRNSSDD